MFELPAHISTLMQQPAINAARTAYQTEEDALNDSKNYIQQAQTSLADLRTTEKTQQQSVNLAQSDYQNKRAIELVAGTQPSVSSSEIDQAIKLLKDTQADIGLVQEVIGKETGQLGPIEGRVSSAARAFYNLVESAILKGIDDELHAVLDRYATSFYLLNVGVGTGVEGVSLNRQFWSGKGNTLNYERGPTTDAQLKFKLMNMTYEVACDDSSHGSPSEFLNQLRA